MAAFGETCKANEENRTHVIRTNETVVLLTDIQTGFQSALLFEQIVEVAKCMVEAAELLEIPVYISEHLGYGTTANKIPTSTNVFLKETFSMLTPEMYNKICEEGRTVKSVILMGVEAHICVEQTAMDLIRHGFNVHIVAEGVSSSKLRDRTFALKRLEKMGCWIETMESILYKLVKSTLHPRHDQIVNILAKVPDDSFDF